MEAKGFDGDREIYLHKTFARSKLNYVSSALVVPKLVVAEIKKRKHVLNIYKIVSKEKFATKTMVDEIEKMIDSELILKTLI